MSARPIIQQLLNRKAGFEPQSFISPRSTVFLAGAEQPAGDHWSPPLPSIASRRPALRGRGSVRGWIIDPTAHREIVFESALERGLAEMLAARRDVEKVIDQPPAVAFTDKTGRTRKHTLDFLAVTRSGARIAFAVKPSGKVSRSDIEDILHQIRSQVGTAFADTILLRTERHITRDRVFNARLILRARSCRDPAVVERLQNLLPAQGTVRICELVATTGLGAYAFNAAVNLVDDGRLVPIGNGRIDYTTSVQITTVAGGEKP